MIRRFVPRLVLLLCASLATAAHAGVPLFTVGPDSLRADQAGNWHASLSLQNLGDWGFYPDSLTVEYRDDAPERSDVPRTTVRSLAPFIRLISPIGTKDTGSMDWNAPAEFDRGTLVFHMRGHDANHQAFALSATVRVAGNALSEACPPILLGQQAARTDMAIVRPDSTRLPAPGLLFVPPQGTSARSLLRWCAALTLRGYSVAVVSLPGSGRSEGGPDRAGPASVAAVREAIDVLARDPSVDHGRVVLWGQREGATTALLAAVDHPGILGVVAQDADFDAWASYRALPGPERAAFVREAGRDSAGWRARSPVAVAERIAAPVLVLQSDEARLAAPEPAEAFAALRANRDLYIEARLSPREPHPLRRPDATRVALDFIARRTRHP